MAFCPHCGTRLGAQASTCEACGASIQAAPPGPDNRFKGTMMMAPASAQPRPTGPGPAAPRPGGPPPNATMLGGFKPEELSRPSPTPARARAGEHPASRDQERPSERGQQAPFDPGGRGQPSFNPSGRGQPAAFNATILGGISVPGERRPGSSPTPQPRPLDPSSYPPAPGRARGAHDAAALGHAPTAMAPTVDAAFGHAPTAMGGMGVRATPQHSAEPAPHRYAPPAASPPPGREESAPRMLAGDPRASGKPYPSAAAGRPYYTDDEDAPRSRIPGQRSTRVSRGTSGLMWVAIGFIGMLAIAGIGVLAAKMLGLM